MKEHEGKYFLFKSEFGWINEIGNSGDGYSLFQQINSEMEGRSSINNDEGLDLEDIVKILTNNKITEVQTIDVSKKEYCGIEAEYIDEDNHGIYYREITEEDILYLRERKIKVSTIRRKNT